MDERGYRRLSVLLRLRAHRSYRRRGAGECIQRFVGAGDHQLGTTPARRSFPAESAVTLTKQTWGSALHPSRPVQVFACFACSALIVVECNRSVTAVLRFSFYVLTAQALSAVRLPALLPSARTPVRPGPGGCRGCAD